MWKAAKSRPSEPLIAGTIRLRDPSLRSMSTAMPRLTGPPSIANGLPSRLSKTRVITGHSFAAWTIAQAIRWVKETFIPRSLRIALRAFRLASRVSTEIVRNEVAVGTSRLSSIAWASIPPARAAAFASPAAAGATAAAPFPPPSAAASTSSLVTFAPGPLPVTAPRSTPFSAATRRATGVALTSAPLAGVGGSAGAARPAGSRGGADASSLRIVVPRDRTLIRGRPCGRTDSSPGSISARGAPTGTSSSTWTSSLVITPAAGAGTSASTLSVETSTTVSPSLTKSPSATCHSRTMPSVTDSPISGI